MCIRDSSNTYSVIVTIDEFPEDAKLKPGMTAEVEILVGVYEDVLAAPIQAIASFGRKKFAFVKNGTDFEPREVTVGKSNISFVVIESGLNQNDVVALDAYQRALTQFEDEEPEEEDQTDELVGALANAEIGKTSDETEDDSDQPEDDSPPTPRLEQDDAPPVPRTDETSALSLIHISEPTRPY